MLRTQRLTMLRRLLRIIARRVSQLVEDELESPHFTRLVDVAQ